MNQAKRAVRRQGISKSIRVTRALATEAVQQDVTPIPFLNPLGQLPPSSSLHEVFNDPEMKRNRGVSVAYHEAGHLFAAYYFGFALKDRAAELTPDGPSLGLTHFCGENIPCDPSSKTRARLEEAVVLLLAGGSAVRKLAKRYESGSHLNGDDYDQAKRMIEMLTPVWRDPDLSWCNVSSWGPESERSYYLRLLECRAERLVSHGWTAIECIAAELLRSNVVTADAVHRIAQNVRAFDQVGVLARMDGAQRNGPRPVC